jgi:hypothetical protein
MSSERSILQTESSKPGELDHPEDSPTHHPFDEPSCNPAREPDEPLPLVFERYLRAVARDDLPEVLEYDARLLDLGLYVEYVTDRAYRSTGEAREELPELLERYERAIARDDMEEAESALWEIYCCGVSAYREHEHAPAREHREGTLALFARFVRAAWADDSQDLATVGAWLKKHLFSVEYLGNRAPDFAPSPTEETDQQDSPWASYDEGPTGISEIERRVGLLLSFGEFFDAAQREDLLVFVQNHFRLKNRGFLVIYLGFNRSESTEGSSPLATTPKVADVADW